VRHVDSAVLRDASIAAFPAYSNTTAKLLGYLEDDTTDKPAQMLLVQRDDMVKDLSRIDHFDSHQAQPLQIGMAGADLSFDK
jgi:hypothetical protein